MSPDFLALSPCSETCGSCIRYPLPTLVPLLLEEGLHHIREGDVFCSCPETAHNAISLPSLCMWEFVTGPSGVQDGFNY